MNKILPCLCMGKGFYLKDGKIVKCQCNFYENFLSFLKLSKVPSVLFKDIKEAIKLNKNEVIDNILFYGKYNNKWKDILMSFVFIHKKGGVAYWISNDNFKVITENRDILKLDLLVFENVEILDFKLLLNFIEYRLVRGLKTILLFESLSQENLKRLKDKKFKMIICD